MSTKKIYIRGMHCASCEKLLDSELRNVRGVKDVKINRRSNSAELFWDEAEPDFEDLKKTAGKFGYEVFEKEPGREEKKSFDGRWREWAKALAVVALLFLAYRELQNFGVLNKFNFSAPNISFGFSFLLGLVASVSSCLAVVGAVIIAFSEKYKSEGKNFFQVAVKPNLLFHAGRLAAFFILGGALGAIGGQINISGNFVSFYTIIIAIVMGWLGLNILGIVPPISNLGIGLPRRFTQNWNTIKNSEHKFAPFLLGGFSFFLPCGFTQSMQLFALASGSFLIGGLSLLLFALGTVPMLLIVGITTSWTRSRKIAVFQKAAGILIIVFAVYIFSSGLALRGTSANVISSPDNKKQSDTKIDVPQNANQGPNVEKQIIKMDVTASGFEPNTFQVKQGVPVEWVINGKNVTGCTSTIIVPSLNISRGLRYGENVIEFTPRKSGDLAFSCGMGMVRGKFVVK